MDKQWKKNAKDTYKKLKDIDPDKASKDEFVLYAACIAVLDHDEQDGESIPAIPENPVRAIETLPATNSGVLDDFSVILSQYANSRSTADRDEMRKILKWQLGEIERELVEMRAQVHDPECVRMFIEFRENLRLKL